MKVLVVSRVHDNRSSGIEQIVKLNSSFCEKLQSREAVVNVVPEHGGRHKNVFVEHVADQIAHANVVVPAVLQNQRSQKSKLTDGKVSCIDSLDSLLSFNSDLMNKNNKRNIH